MPTSTDYQNQYAAYIPVLQGIAEQGDTSNLKERMQQKADYNKPLLDAMSVNQAKKENITNAARWVDNPAMQGMSINDRNTIKNTNMAGANQEGNAIGAYYTARQEDLASAITAWKEAWQAKYNASQEGAKGAKDLQGMAFAGEQEAERVRQFNAEQAQALAIARMQEAGANARAASSGSKADKTSYTKVKNMGGGWSYFADGQPVSVSKYMAGEGVDLSTALGGSTDPGDKKIMNDYNKGGDPNAFAAKYPWLFT